MAQRTRELYGPRAARSALVIISTAASASETMP